MKNKDADLPFVLTYNPNISSVFPSVIKIYRKLQTLKTLGKIFAQHKLTDCKRQPSNLRRLKNIQIFKTTKWVNSCFYCNYVTEAEIRNISEKPEDDIFDKLDMKKLRSKDK